MYIFHETSARCAAHILRDGAIYSLNRIPRRMKNIGYQQYNRSDYVYLNCCEEKFDKIMRSDIIF